MKRDQRLLWWGYAELTAAMALAGSSFVAARVVADEFPVFLGSALRFGAAMILLWPLVHRSRKFRGGIDRRTLGLAFLLALTGVFGYTVLLLFGLRLTSAAEGGIVASTTPAVIALISAVLLGERLRLPALTGIVATVAGVMVVTAVGADGGSSRGSSPLRGDLLVLGAVICEASFTVLGKSVAEKLRPVAIAALLTGCAFLLCLPLALWEARTFDASAISAEGWLATLFYAVATVVSYLLWYDGLRVVPASAAGVFTGVVPISALASAYLVLGEPFRWAQPIGAAIVLFGIILTVRAGAATASTAGRFSMVIRGKCFRWLGRPA